MFSYSLFIPLFDYPIVFDIQFILTFDNLILIFFLHVIVIVLPLHTNDNEYQDNKDDEKIVEDDTFHHYKLTMDWQILNNNDIVKDQRQQKTNGKLNTENIPLLNEV